MKALFRERNPFPIGLIFIVVLVATILAALNADALVAARGRALTAIVPEAAGLKSGDPVRVSGVKVGRVTDVSLADKGVEVAFTVTDDSVDLGSQTSAAIKVATVLGDKELALTSAGGGELSDDTPIPLTRTKAPYDVTTALDTLTTEASQIDTDQVSAALDTVSTTLQGAAPELAGTLDGITRLSRVINSRDQQILELASHANEFSAVLADRSASVKRIIDDGNLLFAELEFRQKAITQLLANIAPLTVQLSGLVADNRADLAPALKNLGNVITILTQNRDNIEATLTNLSSYVTGLGEAVGSGRMFTAQIKNLLPGNLVPVTPNDLLGSLLGGAIQTPSTAGAGAGGVVPGTGARGTGKAGRVEADQKAPAQKKGAGR